MELLWYLQQTEVHSTSNKPNDSCNSQYYTIPY